ncbi:hypothetical protein [Chamaesiphon sp.]|uniref:hypothetical protein n=1 Tax=Chamaesiphon sp. TaxID=2814140 RepID=UPI003592F6C7
MNNWTVAQVAFRCERLSVRMEELAQNFGRIAALSANGMDAETVLAIVQESKAYIELTAIDLDVDRAFELAQIQRQLSRWHLHWLDIWASDTSRSEVSTLAQLWANRIRELAGIFV